MKVRIGEHVNFLHGERGEELKMVANYEKNIHFGENAISLKVYILKEFTGEFYGETLKVQLNGFIRPKKKYDEKPSSLISSIEKDVKIAKYAFKKEKGNKLH